MKNKRYTTTTLLVQVIMSVLAVLFIAPLLMIINYSFKTKKELYLTSPLSLPSSFQLDNYKKAFDKLDLATTFTNTFLYTAVSVLILALLCGTTAWAIEIGRASCRERV